MAQKKSNTTPSDPSNDLQTLFERYNRRYWRSRLPNYTVLVTEKYKGRYGLE